jgi:Fe-S-cluster containining protein
MSTPCLNCGACCACYRVAFHWSEAEPFLGGTVPAEMAVKLDQHRLAMRGTESGREPRCAALSGTIGESVQCGIYALRPSPCRELQPDWQNGHSSDQCRRARARHGLPPLEPPNWEDPQGPRDLPRSA